jgi:hypothetical protein
MRLETDDGHYVATVRPVLPMEPTDVVIWGQRIFLRRGMIATAAEDIWQEITMPTVVISDTVPGS